LIIFKKKKFNIEKLSDKQKERLKDFVLNFMNIEFSDYTYNPPRYEDYINLHEDIYKFNGKKYYFDDLPTLMQMDLENEYFDIYNQYIENQVIYENTYEEYIDFLFDYYGKIKDDKSGKKYYVEINYANINNLLVECDMCGKTYRTKIGVYEKYHDEFNADLCVNCRNKYGYGLFGIVPSSKQQRYLCNLLNGKLNHKIGNYYADILLENYNVVVEYDGSGHDLFRTKNEKQQEDLQRELFMLDKGFKTIRIKSKFDYLPQDDDIISSINKALSELNRGFNRYEIIVNDKNFKNLRLIKEA